jgi:chromosome partitioning protein
MARTRTPTIAFGNQKGGTAKTTTTINVGPCLADEGRKVLICDLDPQGSCSLGLGIDSYGLEHTIYDVLCRDRDIRDAIIPTGIKNLWLLPANIELAAAEFELISALRREEIFGQKIAPVSEEYDFILLDLPPSLGILTINGLTASSHLIIPIETEFYPMAGVKMMLQLRDLVASRLGHTLETRFLLTKFDVRTKLSVEVADMIRQNFKDQVFKTVIPRAVKVAEAPSHGKPVTLYAPESPASTAYRTLVREEILQLVR